MKSITLALTVSLLISYAFNTVNATFDEGFGSSLPRRGGQKVTDFGKNRDAQLVCTANGYTQHHLAYPCIALCSGSTTKGKASEEIPLPKGSRCSLGGKRSACSNGGCGKPHDPNAEYLETLEQYIDDSETLKSLGPKGIADFKAKIHKFKPKTAEERNAFVKAIVESLSDLAKKNPGAFRGFKPADS